jgi:hypothetical protein
MVELCQLTDIRTSAGQSVSRSRRANVYGVTSGLATIVE